MSNVLATYSGKDLNVTALNGPLGIAIQIAGVESLGLEGATVRMSTVRTNVKIGIDGAGVPSFIPGDNGEIEIRVWQTSVLHGALLDWWNAVLAAAQMGDVSNSYGGQVTVQNTVTGRRHIAKGVCPQKPPDLTYGVEAQPISWVLTCIDIQNM